MNTHQDANEISFESSNNTDPLHDRIELIMPVDLPNPLDSLPACINQPSTSEHSVNRNENLHGATSSEPNLQRDDNAQQPRANSAQNEVGELTASVGEPRQGAHWYACAECPYIADQSYNLNRHRRNRHGPPGQRQRPRCPKCGKSFSDSSNLRRHLRNIHGIQKPCGPC
mmetsp:Transcript_2049/g.4528  ORF Transcript_2049/g.4528 Transcript_2049/m.4528 type:complete len:170 (-) Transcript_2049:57-566(-)